MLMDRDVTASDSVLRALGVNRDEYTRVKEEERQRQEESIRAARAEGKRLYGDLHGARFGMDTRSVYLGDGLRIPIPDLADKTSDESMVDTADRVIGYMERVYQLPPDQLSTAVHADQDRPPESINPDEWLVY